MDIQIPLDVQLKLLEHLTSKQAVDNFFNNVRQKVLARDIKAIRALNDRIIAFASCGKEFIFAARLDGTIYYEREFRCSILHYESHEWQQCKDTAIKQIKSDLETLVAPIRLYQGSIADVSKQLDAPLRMVNTGTSEAFIRAFSNEVYCDEDMPLYIRARAFFLGADAVVNYKEHVNISVFDVPDRFDAHIEIHKSSCAMGTPVKFQKVHGVSKNPPASSRTRHI